MIINKLKVRHLKRDDVPFVTNSWLKSYKYEAEKQSIRNKIYFDNHHGFITVLLKQALSNSGLTTVLIACNANDEDQILGYIVFQSNEHSKECLHFIYVKGSLREQGIARFLIEASELKDSIEYSHETKFLKHIIKYFESADKNPYKFFTYGNLPRQAREI